LIVKNHFTPHRSVVEHPYSSQLDETPIYIMTISWRQATSTVKPGYNSSFGASQGYRCIEVIGLRSSLGRGLGTPSLDVIGRP